MTAKIDTNLQATSPTIGTERGEKKASSGPEKQPKTIKEGPPSPYQKELDERVSIWKSIQEAGGVDKWVEAHLNEKRLADDGREPSRMSEQEKAIYKERKKAEAVERRILRRKAWQAYHATHIVHLGLGIHWHDKANADRFDIDQREERARALRLDEFSTAEDIAKLLGLSIAHLRWLTFHREVDTNTHYQRWAIPKRDGGLRTITAPKHLLKEAQRKALRHIFEKLPVHAAAHGFLAARSIVSNAEVHAGADTIVKVDIKDFFPTVTWRRVKGLLRKSGLPERVATLLSLLATESPREVIEFRNKTLYVASGPRSLPQGAPTSPAITNAICLRLDRRMAGLARSLGFRYSRYADDLTFSWRKPENPAPSTYPRASVGALLHAIKTILRTEGFRIHPTKTKVMRAGGETDCYWVGGQQSSR